MTSIRAPRPSTSYVAPQPPLQRLQTVIDVQRAFRAWRQNESALGYRPAALVPPPSCKDPCARLLHVAQVRVGTGYWSARFSDNPSWGSARHVAATMQPDDLHRLQRQGHVLRSMSAYALDKHEDERGFYLPVMDWLSASDVEVRRAAACLVLQPHTPSNCVQFVYTTLYAAGCISKKQCQRALGDPSEGYLHLGFAAAKPIDERPPQPGDILFTTIDGEPFHVALCESSTTYLQLSGSVSAAPRRVERSDMQVLFERNGTERTVGRAAGHAKIGTYRVLACALADALAGLTLRETPT